MDMNSWAMLARLAGEAKAELEATEPGAEVEIDPCETIMALAGGAVRDGTWTTDPGVLAAWLDRGKRVAVAAGIPESDLLNAAQCRRQAATPDDDRPTNMRLLRGRTESEPDCGWELFSMPSNGYGPVPRHRVAIFAA